MSLSEAKKRFIDLSDIRHGEVNPKEHIAEQKQKNQSTVKNLALNWYTNYIEKHRAQPLQIWQHIKIELVTLNNKTLLVIEVFVSNTGPHWMNSEGSTQGIYVRLGSTNRQADQELITELHRRSEGVNFDEMPMPELSVDDVDITKAQELFSDIKSLNKKKIFGVSLLLCCAKQLSMHLFILTTLNVVRQFEFPFLTTV